MPISRLSAEEANRNLRRNRASIWPDGRLPTDRLGELAKATFKPSFTFSRQDRILTIGSCFAREIEHRLAALGFDLPMKEVTVPREERQTKTENDILSKYTVQSMENELVWAENPAAAPPPEKLFLQVGEDLWHDPQLVHNVLPASLERVIQRREMVQRAFRQLSSCRVVVITLGLAEAWFDLETGLYLNTAPPPSALKRYPGRFALDVLSYEDIYSSLERIHALLSRCGHPEFRMLITVSPVPFKATFTGEDALSANTYSKSVQRAACQAFVARHENVDYFPSYEIVTLSNRELVYEHDNIHVSSSTVAYIVDQVLTRYAPEVEFMPAKVGTPKTRRDNAQSKPFDLFTIANHHFYEGDLDKAAETYQSLLDRFEQELSERDRAHARQSYGTTLMRLQREAEAIEQFEQAVKLAPGDAEIWFKLSQAYARTGRRKEAQSAIERARRINPNAPEYRRAVPGSRGLDAWLAGLRRLAPKPAVAGD